MSIGSLKLIIKHCFNNFNAYRDSITETGVTIKAIGESRGNGNGETPPGTPPRRMSRSSSPKTVGFHQGRSNSPRAHVLSSRSSSPNIQTRNMSPFGELEKTSRSSSPVPIPGISSEKLSFVTCTVLF